MEVPALIFSTYQTKNSTDNACYVCAHEKYLAEFIIRKNLICKGFQPISRTRKTAISVELNRKKYIMPQDYVVTILKFCCNLRQNYWEKKNELSA